MKLLNKQKYFYIDRPISILYIYVHMDFLENLKYARKKAGFTQSQVEELLNIRKLSMKDYETGRLKIPVELALKIANLYKTDLNSLFGKYESIAHSLDLGSINGLWDQKFSNIILLDPIIKAHLENYKEKQLELSLLDIILINFSKSNKKKYAIESAKFMNSLIGIDAKILPSEISLRDSLLNHFDCAKEISKIKIYLEEPYFPDQLHESLYPLPAKHFLLWLLFFLAYFDKEVDFREEKYLEKCAEKLKVTKSNFSFIKDFFQSKELS